MKATFVKYFYLKPILFKYVPPILEVIQNLNKIVSILLVAFGLQIAILNNIETRGAAPSSIFSVLQSAGQMLLTI